MDRLVGTMRPILLKGHDGPLTCVKYNRDGDLLFTTCRRGRVCLFYSDDGERLGTYVGHNGAVLYSDVSCESTSSRRLLCDLFLHDALLDKLSVQPVLRAKCFVISCSFTILAVGSDKLATASMDQSTKLWEVETGQIIRSWTVDSGVRCVSIASGDKRIAALCDPWDKNPSTIKIFDTSSSSEKPIMVMPMDPGARVNRALWGPLNKQIITCNEQGAVLSWDPTSGECTHERCEHEQNVGDITFSLDQMTFISASADMSAIVSSSKYSFSALFSLLCTP